jgi:NAD(P)-dependent dehydrogenase (short-subunit alcohol dehydrogenase family)
MSKVIVLTGATRGLGRALVPVFASGGHTVIGCGRSEKHLAELWAAFPAPHSFSAIDVANPGAVERWANQVVAKYGPPDLLINNAAVMNTPAPLWKIDNEEFDTLIDVNVKGVFHVVARE